MSHRAVIITTINPPNPVVQALRDGAAARNMPFIVVGDTKTDNASYAGFEHYYSIDRQVAEYADLCKVLPTRHYARKNIGYLAAMVMGVDEIQETDDDNVPREDFWLDVPSPLDVDRLTCDQPWFNVYKLFSDELIWPRGLPLQFVQADNPHRLAPGASKAIIVQDLADDNPDVDAVYRLTRSLPVRFGSRKPVALDPGVWCPFNTQATILREQAFPLLYLPATCSFRMTDIWRSFVAQRCLWELGEGVVFRSPTVYQERNEHNLLRDFEDEVPGYLHNDRIRQILTGLSLDGGDLYRSVIVCYEALIKAGLIKEVEMSILRAWCEQAMAIQA